MDLVYGRTAALVVVTALGYAGAALAMKAMAGGSPGWPMPAAIATCFILATAAEIALLRDIHLGIVYIAVIGIETLIVVVAAAMLGESFGPREILGAGLVLSGTVMLGLGD